ncbi:MAG: phosphotransferase [Actinomycetota bacterium]
MNTAGDDAMTTVGLDAEWIGATMGEALGGVATASFDGFIGTGQMSRNARFGLTWSEGEGPSSVVVKLPSGDAGTRAVSFEHNVYVRECTFYDSIQPLVDVAVPGCYAVHLDAPNDFAILLEDMLGSEQGDQFREATTDELHTSIEQAAALHAPVWGRVTEPVFAALRDDVDERADRAVETMGFFHAVVMERIGDRLDPDMHPFLERFVAQAADWTRARAKPQTLVHGDFRPDNFMVATSAGAPPLAVVDWQTVSPGLGVSDIAYLIAGALTPEDRRAQEEALLEKYRNELARRGVDYHADDCEREYAIGAIHGVIVAVTATVMAERTERGDALFTQMINRHGRHCLDLESLDRL